MAVVYTTKKIVESVKRRAGVPTNQSLYTDTDVLAFINEAMYGDIIPIILAEREDYLIDSVTMDIEANKNKYPIPFNAIGGKLRSIETIQNNDNDTFSIVPQIQIEQLGQPFSSGSGSSRVFYFEANNVVLFPTPKNTDGSIKLRLKYFRRPNELVVSTQGALVNGIDLATNTLSLSNVPSSWIVGDTIDIVKGRPPFTVVSAGISIVSIAGNDVQFSAGELDDVVLQDTLALEGFSIVPNISMPEAHSLMEQAGVIRLLEGVDDGNGLRTAVELYSNQKDSFRKLITPRADSSSKKIVSTNDFLSNSRYWGYS